MTKADILFLDVDGVLNRAGTRERIGPYLGVDAKLAEIFLEWERDHGNLDIVLSSTWRKHEEMKIGLSMAGVTWVGETPHIPSAVRGQEIEEFLADAEFRNYVILDDNSDMLASQRPHFVQTKTDIGITAAHLQQIDRIFAA